MIKDKRNYSSNAHIYENVTRIIPISEKMGVEQKSETDTKTRSEERSGTNRRKRCSWCKGKLEQRKTFCPSCSCDFLSTFGI